jgi:cytochrome d ubiquinol oxidase subunit I
MTTLLLSRLQFAFTISFHILFPAFSIGLATFLMLMEAAWLITKRAIYYTICQFWIKVFAITFGMGVVSGIVMEFQLGTNWSGFSRMIGPVLGELFTYEVLTAFFIEAGFLGVMLFGWKKVGEKLHFLSTFLVWLGVTISAFWILSANSWMQTPSGATFQNGHFTVTSWAHVIFNPSFIPRYIHMLLASYLSALFAIAAISAYYLLKRDHLAFAKKCFAFAMIAIMILIPLQIYMGDETGLKVLEYQPMKTAAMEGVWQTQAGAPLLLFAIPDQAAQKNLYALAIPHLASVINTHSWNGVMHGLNTVAVTEQPPVAWVFFSFRIMVGIGMLMLLTGMVALFLLVKRKLYDTRWFLHWSVWMAPAGFIALITGWITAEEGRQPWVVYGLIKTQDAVSQVSVNNVIISFALLFIVYGIIFGVFYFKYLFKLIRKGPNSREKTYMSLFGYMPGDH